ncbi:MAG: chromophore lyase CpcT/CpeT [Blastocatellia bacterium]|nr:chromophore lyase CpcT/CpeT [Blastocatellia bacterium]
MLNNLHSSFSKSTVERLLFMLRKLLFLIVILFGVSSATFAQKSDLEKLASLMQGSFSSRQQSEADKDYFHITLHIAPIWKDRQDGYWFYVEQAVGTQQEKPYRQRVYHLTKVGEDLYESRVYTLPNPEKVIGEWKKSEPLATLSPDQLQLRDGCSVFLKKKADQTFEGATDGKKCPSDLRGAAYATSEVIITAEGLKTWDRGYNQDDSQVWGATKGPYIFKRD